MLVLVLGLLALAIVAISSDLSTATVRKLSTAPRWPTAGVPDRLAAKFFSPFNEDWLRTLTVLMTIVYFGSVSALGSTIVGALRGATTWPRAVSALAGFLPGYLMVLGPLQLLFATVPLVTASWIALLGVPAAAAVLHRRTIVAEVERLGSDGDHRRITTLTTLAVAVLVSLAAVHRLQASGYFLTQDSITWFLVAASDQLGQGAHGFVLGAGSSQHYLGQWNQQSDEWLFNAPLMFSSHASHDFEFPLYISQSLSLASFSCLVFGLARRFAERRRLLAASVAVVAVLASSPSIYLWRYVVTITGDNPVLWTGHTGRHIGIIAPWVAALLIGPQRRSVIVASARATLGLGFTSLQVLTWVLAAVTAALVLRAVFERDALRVETRVPGWLVQAVPVAVLATIVFTFWWVHHVRAPSIAGWWLLIAATAAALTAVTLVAEVARSGRPVLARGHPGWVAAWLGALVLGLLLSNNMTEHLFHGEVRDLFGSFLPGYDQPLLARPDLPKDLFAGMTFSQYTGRRCTLLQCQSFAGFLACWGVLVVVCMASWLALGPATRDAAVAWRRAVWLLLVTALTLSFVIVSFTGSRTHDQIIILTRFFEVPYYGLLAFAAVAFATSRNRVTAIVGTGVLLAWAIVPAVVGQWPQQMVSNVAWIVRRLF